MTESRLFSQDTDGSQAAPEIGDRFGTTLATSDFKCDSLKRAIESNAGARPGTHGSGVHFLPSDG